MKAYYLRTDEWEYNYMIPEELIEQFDDDSSILFKASIEFEQEEYDDLEAEYNELYSKYIVENLHEIKLYSKELLECQ